jgi:16S rRNA (adenine1518-N6/adenine1519-N6)-dimethyltransferase
MGNPKTLKQYGQHWLVHSPSLHAIAAAAHLRGEETVLEIGPGTGNLTELLLAQAKQVLAVEIDHRLLRGLQKRFEEEEPNRLQVLQGDILATNLNELPIAPEVVIANIPYYITGPILEKLLGPIDQPIQQFKQIILLVQKEVGERLAAPPGSKTYGALSVKVQYLAEVSVVCSIPARYFSPKPKVDSVVVHLAPRSFPHIAQDPKFLKKLVNASFATRRKMLRNCLKSLVTPEQWHEFTQKQGISESVRAEELRVEDFVALSNFLGEPIIVSNG